ncbi:ester cyclase [Halobacillus shinanisalinarum]|uniref:Ester cyclase n=1 Tax=Halobacillus shinanisalinarum TaxID=2932258 RepID=A0ABY4H6U4_9BACI|nr:ester cyclase [Halobacillus shinanisalinarum]UOQ95775.1 ester cyclase [Halobacillus shinanisalinarum]
MLDDQRVSGYWEMNALYHGNMEGAKVEKGTPISFRGMDILIFKDDKCVEYYVLSDMFSLMKQLQAIKT